MAGGPEWGAAECLRGAPLSRSHRSHPSNPREELLSGEATWLPGLLSIRVITLPAILGQSPLSSVALWLPIPGLVGRDPC